MSGETVAAPAPALPAPELPAAPRTAPAPAAVRAESLRRAIVRGLVLALALIAGAVFMVDWNELLLWSAVQRTDDATLHSAPVEIDARVAGVLTAVPVADMAQVAAGDTLFRIDDATYRAQVALADAELEAAAADVATASAQIALQERQIDIARGGEELAASNALLAQQTQARENALSGTAAARSTDIEGANANALAAAAALAGAQAAVAGAEAQLKVLQAGLAQAQAGLQARAAALDAARITLGYTNVTAPRDGRVGYRLAHVGQYVQPGTPLIALVPRRDTWVIANFRETQLRRMHPGQPATVTVDAYPGVVLKGHVDSIDPTSQALGSLLPPDRSVGSFTRITQRIPVKIVFDAGDIRNQGVAGRMAPGLSVEAAVDTSK